MCICEIFLKANKYNWYFDYCCCIIHIQLLVLCIFFVIGVKCKYIITHFIADKKNNVALFKCRTNFLELQLIFTSHCSLY